MNIRQILFALCLLVATGAYAQQRKCDMQITLLEPASSSVINALAQYNITVNILNNGPDTLFAGDTLYYNQPSQPLFNYNPFVLTQTLAAGRNATVTLESPHNTNDNEQDETMDYYIFVMSNPAHNGAFIDTANTVNNYDVNTNVTFRAANPTDIKDIQNSRIALQVYPNPAASMIRFNLDAGNTASSVSISDISGREVLNHTFIKKAGGQDPDLNIGSLTSGMYLVRIQTEQGRATAKLIKE